MEGLEQVAFEIISTVGTARSCYIEAIQKAKEGKMDEIEDLFKAGDEAFNEGHNAHMGLLTKEAEGNSEGVNLLLLHAEDQLIYRCIYKINKIRRKIKIILRSK